MIVTVNSTQFQFDTRVILCSDIGGIQLRDNSFYVYPVVKDPKIIATRRPLIIVRYSDINSYNGSTAIPAQTSILQDLNYFWKKTTTPAVFSLDDKAKLSALPNITQGSTPPTNPMVGDIWIH